MYILLLTFQWRGGYRGFPQTLTFLQINAQILGVDGRELPWEGSNRAAAEEQLGSLAEPVLGLLQRNPEDRWTLERFCAVVYPRCGGHVHQ